MSSIRSVYISGACYFAEVDWAFCICYEYLIPKMEAVYYNIT